jgi:hypothetical protein
MVNLKSASDLYKIYNNYQDNSKNLTKKIDFNNIDREYIDFLFGNAKPKLKYLYKVQCEGGDNMLTSIGCYVKSIDKPKIDVEYTEQVRNNTIRYYPIKYSFSEVSMTYYDSGDSLITNFFYSFIKTQIIDVADSGKGRGIFYGRQGMMSNGSIIRVRQIPVHLGDTKASDNMLNKSFDIRFPAKDIEYVFYNVQITSIEGEQFDSDDDSGFLTYTVTFKYEFAEIIWV